MELDRFKATSQEVLESIGWGNEEVLGANNRTAKDLATSTMSDTQTKGCVSFEQQLVNVSTGHIDSRWGILFWGSPIYKAHTQDEALKLLKDFEDQFAFGSFRDLSIRVPLKACVLRD